MAIRNDLSKTIRRIARLFYWFPKSLSSSRRRTVKLLWKSAGHGYDLHSAGDGLDTAAGWKQLDTAADCKYTCHAHCRDLVHLGCRRNGKLMDCLAPQDTLEPSYSNGQLYCLPWQGVGAYRELDDSTPRPLSFPYANFRLYFCLTIHINGTVRVRMNSSPVY
ncbi:hypothetical protein Q9966_002087 [Columba livia]|nr:hypothetical protein Q9966_002087 [Columba livia]